MYRTIPTFLTVERGRTILPRLEAELAEPVRGGGVERMDLQEEGKAACDCLKVAWIYPYSKPIDIVHRAIVLNLPIVIMGRGSGARTHSVNIPSDNNN